MQGPCNARCELMEKIKGRCPAASDLAIVVSSSTSGGFKPVNLRHLDIHASRYPLRPSPLQTSNEFDSLKTSRSFSGDLELGNPGQERLQEFSKSHVLIRDQDPHGHRSQSSPAVSKTTSSRYCEQLGRYMQIHKEIPSFQIEVNA
jgi:hypothetical protein